MKDIGSEVTWESASQGKAKSKTGIVLAFLPSRKLIVRTQIEQAVVDAGIAVSGGEIYKVLTVSSHDRYLVAVPRIHKRTGNPLPALLYTPLASVIDRQNP